MAAGVTASRNKLKRAPCPYSSRIIKAGALRADSRAFLRAYDESLSVAENLRRLLTKNILGKASRSRAADILPVFRQRFCDNAALARPLCRLARSEVAPEVLDRILYFHAARSDRLLGDFVRRFIAERYRSGDLNLRLQDAERSVGSLLRESGAPAWSASTLRRVAHGLLATLRDFRILEGAVKKRIAPVYLPVEAFAYLALLLSLEGASGERLLRHSDWELFLLAPQATEQLCLEAHARRLLSYHAAGRVVRIEFPVTTLEEMVDAIARRAH